MSFIPTRRALVPLIATGILWTLGSAASAQHMTRSKDELKLMKAPGIDQAFNMADVDFMAGMIPHHAQAVVMAKMAPSQGESPTLKNLCERIVVGQGYEIKMMRQWLADRGQDVPPADATRYRMKMGDMVHEMLMPGMLTDEEMAALGKARGKEWDRLFLIGMIKHHQGAIDMVEVLAKSWGSMQGDDIYKFSSDVYADQTTEIEVMKQMLAAIK
ncbi:MAG TPA: DUF305 domain-containing protein [Vicinamibacterales bacterium]|nr:DUF305 domain-containing protein [Vicinamibacterales bacterium]